MTTAGLRPAWAGVDLRALRANVAAVRELAGGAAVCAVVKADGYGHGAVAVARAALEAGAAQLAVALVEEGVELREAAIEAPILLLSEPPAEAAGEVVRWSLTPTLYTDEGVDAVARAAGAAGRVVGVHIKVDTGMHRVGAAPAVARRLARRVAEEPALDLEAVWTHFAVADEPAQAEFTREQRRRFDELCDALAADGITPRLRHVANSAGLLYVGAALDVVRAGIAIYGYAPHPEVPAPMELEPVLSLVARATFVRELDAGERLSYGLRHRLERRSVVATVPLGYADGVPRRLSETGGSVLVGGRRCPIAGTVTMDQLMVDCGPEAAVRPGDEVVLIGRQGDEVITAEDWAARLGTISYEILCGIGPRVPRMYRQ